MKIFNYRITFNFDLASFSKINWLPFFVGMITVATLQIAMLAGFNPASFISPLPKHSDSFDKVKPKLQQKENTFKLNQSRSFIPEVHAASAHENFENASAYAVLDLEDGTVIAEKNIDEKLPIASITKIMSAVVTLDLVSPEELFTITPNAAGKIPTKIGVVPGEKMTVRELLHASLLTSANDATEALKDGVDAKYGKGTFIKAMNEKARFIGMKNSQFDNPQGFDSEQNYSTVEDLSLLAHYSLENYPLISEIVKKDFTYLPANEYHREFKLYNWNGLLGVYPHVYGLKIGNTDKAGVTTIVASERDGHKILAVVLGTPDVIKRDIWASELLDYGFANFGLKPISITEASLRSKYASWHF